MVIKILYEFLCVISVFTRLILQSIIEVVAYLQANMAKTNPYPVLKWKNYENIKT